MNYITHLNSFFAYVKKDRHLAASHISLYMALFHYWNFNRFQNPFPIYRQEIMTLSKIGSKNTYHKCIKELHREGYIMYHPATSRYQPIKVSLLLLTMPAEQSSNNAQQSQLLKKQAAGTDINTPPGTGNGTQSSPKYGTQQVPDLITTSINIGTQHVPESVFLVKHTNDENNVCTHTPEIFKLKQQIKWPINQNAPPMPEVEKYFRDLGYPPEEAKKFFHYNQSKSWMITPGTPITEWQSMVHKWILKIHSSQKNQAIPNDRTSENTTRAENTRTDQDYSEPL